MGEIEEIKLKLDTLERNYSIIQNLTELSSENKINYNGNVRLISDIINEIITLLRNNCGISINNNINTLNDLKDTIDQYQSNFDSICTEITGIEQDIKNLQLEKRKIETDIDKFENYKGLQEIEKFISPNIQMIINLSLKNNSNVSNKLQEILKKLKNVIDKSTYENVENVINMCSLNGNKNLDGVIRILQQVTSSVKNFSVQYEVGILIQELQDEKNNNKIKISDIISLLDQSLTVPLKAFLSENGLTPDSVVDINTFLKLMKKNIDDYSRIYDGTTRDDLNQSLTSKNNELTAKTNELSTKKAQVGVISTLQLTRKRNDIVTVQNYINGLVTQKKDDDRTLETAKTESQSIIDSLGKKHDKLISLLIDERKKKIDELEKIISDPTKYRNFLIQKGVNLNGLSEYKITKLAIEHYILSLNQIYTSTIQSYVKYQFQIPQYIDQYDYRKNHSYTELQDIKELNDFNGDLNILLSEVTDRITKTVEAMKTSEFEKFEENILKSQDIDKKIQDLQYQQSINRRKNIVQKIQFKYISHRIERLSKKNESLKIKRQDKVINIISSSFSGLKLRSDVKRVNGYKSWLQKSKDSKTMMEAFNPNDVNQLLRFDEYVDQSEEQTMKFY